MTDDNPHAGTFATGILGGIGGGSEGALLLQLDGTGDTFDQQNEHFPHPLLFTVSANIEDIASAEDIWRWSVGGFEGGGILVPAGCAAIIPDGGEGVWKISVQAVMSGNTTAGGSPSSDRTAVYLIRNEGADNTGSLIPANVLYTATYGFNSGHGGTLSSPSALGGTVVGSVYISPVLALLDVGDMIWGTFFSQQAGFGSTRKIVTMSAAMLSMHYLGTLP